MRQLSDVENEIWGKNGELLTYLKNVKAMMKKNQKKKNLEK